MAACGELKAEVPFAVDYERGVFDGSRPGYRANTPPNVVSRSPFPSPYNAKSHPEIAAAVRASSFGALPRPAAASGSSSVARSLVEEDVPACAAHDEDDAEEGAAVAPAAPAKRAPEEEVGAGGAKRKQMEE